MDAYSHLYLRALDEVLAEDHPLRWIVQPSLESLMDRTVTNPRWHDKACKWCQKPSYDTVNCSMIHWCLLCQSWGHLKENCKIPHKLCQGDNPCQVPKDHRLYRSCFCLGLAYKTRVYNALPAISIMDKPDRCLPARVVSYM
jgi:hypothetical protein